MRKQRGDTIVEVLFAMVVIGVSLAVAFGIANRSLQISRSSQERTEAQKIAESQIELIKAVLSSADNGQTNSVISRITSPSENFCLYRDNNGDIEVGNINRNNSPCEGITPLDSGVEYAIGVTYERAGPGNSGPITEYAVTVTWERIGTSSTEPGTLTLYYRPGYIAFAPAPPVPPVPPPPLPVPNPACAVSYDINITDYVNNPSNNISSNRRSMLQDVYYTRDGMYLLGGWSGIQPSKSVNNGDYFPLNPLVNLSSWSHPDILLPSGLGLSSGCNYVIEWEVHCSSGNPYGSLPTTCDDQQNEAAWINFYDSSTGSGNSASCSGNRVAGFRTSDTLGTPVSWNGTAIGQNIIVPSDVRCIEFEHVCISAPLLCEPPASDTASVFISRLRWTSAP